MAEKVDVLRGPDTVDWSDVMGTLVLFLVMLLRWRFLNVHPPSARHAIYYSLLLINIHTKVQYAVWSFVRDNPNGVPLRYLFSAVSFDGAGMQATDPRDMVYALLGLVDREDRERIVVRYDNNWSWRDTYTQAACVLYRESNVNLLEYAEKRGAPTKSELPSWVPDWRGRTRYSSVFASFDRQIPVSEFVFNANSNPDILTLEGFKLDAIKGLGCTSDLIWTDRASLKEQVEFESELRSWIEEIGSLI